MTLTATASAARIVASIGSVPAASLAAMSTDPMDDVAAPLAGSPLPSQCHYLSQRRHPLPPPLTVRSGAPKVGASADEEPVAAATAGTYVSSTDVV